MNGNLKYWVIAFVLTIAAAYYQRITGPTYPVRGKVETSSGTVKYKLPRSADTKSDLVFGIPVKGETRGVLKYKRYNTNDEWTEFDLIPVNDTLKAVLPKQPAAGKIVYEINLVDGNNIIPLYSEPIVVRFKGEVPAWALIPHIILIFLAMLLSNLTGILAIKKRDSTRRYVFISAIILFIGGMIMGPVVQKFAFGELWTGVPFGWDLTDNKTLIAMLAWIVAVVASRKKLSYGWVIAASIVTLVIFLIPHSLFGSELDYTTGVVRQGQ